MLGYEYEFTKLLIKEFWYVPNAPQPFCEVVDWEPVLTKLDNRVKEKEARKTQARRAHAEHLHQEAVAARVEKKAPPPPQELDDDTLGQFGL